MPFKRPLDDIFSQTGKVRVLRHLVQTRLEQHGRAIAAELGMSPTACHQALKSLSAAGVVRTRVAGKTHFYQLNENHYIVKEMLLPLFARERNLLKQALSEIAELAAPAALSVVLFGSVARGEEHYGSDCDVLIVVATETDKQHAKDIFFERSAELAERFGHLPTPLFWTRVELVNYFDRRTNLLNEILRDGRVIHGHALSDISREARQLLKTRQRR
jgi:predicted nucleotidyltransferase